MKRIKRKEFDLLIDKIFDVHAVYLGGYGGGEDGLDCFRWEEAARDLLKALGVEIEE